MQNLEQFRAAAALKTAPKTSKAAISKLPAMILANGLLATAAFAAEKTKDGKKPRRVEMKAAFDGAALHLASQPIGMSLLKGCADTEGLIQKLASANSNHLQRATAEALAFIGYVKRFTTKEGQEERGDI